MISLTNVSKKFNENEVLKEVNTKFNTGMNFILGPSGSGKSTLLNILSGIDKEYDGEVLIRGRNLKDLSENEINEYHYNSVGFIWQDFKLIEHLTVKENISVALELSNISETIKQTKINGIMKKLDINTLKNKKVNSLSGGQKQRVAIARSIIKNPDIIIADEPTGALDKKTSEIIINTLKELSKHKVVIVVTHDKSLIDDNSNCFEIKGGKLIKISKSKSEFLYNLKPDNKKPILTVNRAFKIGIQNFKGLYLRFISISLIVAIASYLLVLNVNNSVQNENEQIINSMIEQRGDRLKDISITKGVISGTGTSNQDEESTSVDMEQDISGLFDKYKDDERVEHITVGTSLDGMNLSIDGLLDNYTVHRSNYQSVPGPMVAGDMPGVDGKEVAVTKLFLENAGLKPKEVIGKKMDLKATVLDHDGSNSYQIENYTERNIVIEDIEIVGVIDSTERVTIGNGEVFENEVEDGFYYSIELAKHIEGVENEDNMSFTLRIKNIEDVLDVASELDEMGITPFGEFKQIEDLLKMSNETSNQSSSISIIIGILALAVILITAIINAFLRKNEIAILRINGYSKQSILKISMVENLIISTIGATLLVVMYPLIGMISESVMSIVASKESIIIGVLISLLLGTLMAIISSIIYFTMKIDKNLSGSKR